MPCSLVCSLQDLHCSPLRWKSEQLPASLHLSPLPLAIISQRLVRLALWSHLHILSVASDVICLGLETWTHWRQLSTPLLSPHLSRAVILFPVQRSCSWMERLSNSPTVAHLVNWPTWNLNPALSDSNIWLLTSTLRSFRVPSDCYGPWVLHEFQGVRELF